MGRLSPDQAAGDSERLSPQEFVARAHVDPTEHLRLGMHVRRMLRDAFTNDQNQGEQSNHDLDRMFSGLFELPSQRDRDERCATGRMQECMGEPTLEKLQGIVEVSKNPGFEFLRKAVYRVLEGGSLAQKKMAARALQGVDPNMASVARALEQLADKSQEEKQLPSSGGVPHKALICPNIGGDPH